MQIYTLQSYMLAYYTECKTITYLMHSKRINASLDMKSRIDAIDGSGKNNLFDKWIQS